VNSPRRPARDAGRDVCLGAASQGGKGERGLIAGLVRLVPPLVAAGFLRSALGLDDFLLKFGFTLACVVIWNVLLVLVLAVVRRRWRALT
jgi:hypothetical protein